MRTILNILLLLSLLSGTIHGQTAELMVERGTRAAISQISFDDEGRLTVRSGFRSTLVWDVERRKLLSIQINDDFSGQRRSNGFVASSATSERADENADQPLAPPERQLISLPNPAFTYERKPSAGDQEEVVVFYRNAGQDPLDSVNLTALAGGGFYDAKILDIHPNGRQLLLTGATKTTAGSPPYTYETRQQHYVRYNLETDTIDLFFSSPSTVGAPRNAPGGNVNFIPTAFPLIRYAPDGKTVALVNQSAVLLYDMPAGRYLTSLAVTPWHYDRLRPDSTGNGVYFAGSYDNLYWNWQRANRLRQGASLPQEINDRAYSAETKILATTPTTYDTIATVGVSPVTEQSLTPLAPALGDTTGLSGLEKSLRITVVDPGTVEDTPDSLLLFSEEWLAYQQRFLAQGRDESEASSAFSASKRSYISERSTNGENSAASPETALYFFRYERGRPVSKRRVLLSGARYLLSGHAFGKNLVALKDDRGIVHLFDGGGEHLFELPGHGAGGSSLVFVNGDRRLLATAGDGSTRIWDTTNGRLLGTIFVLDEARWVVINPDNLFDASPRGMELLHFVVTDTAGRQDIVDLRQMQNNYYEPYLLQKLLGYSNRPLPKVNRLEDIPLFPRAELTVANDSARIVLTPRAGGVGRVALYADGKELAADVNADRLTEFAVPLKPYGRYLFQHNRLSIRYYDADETLYGESFSRYFYPPGFRAKGSENTGADAGAGVGELSEEERQDVRLFIISVGTSTYAAAGPGQRSLTLQYPDKDAAVVARSLRLIGHELFNADGQVTAYCSNTSRAMQPDLAKDNIEWVYATKDSIAATFRKVREAARVQDVVVVFLSGHGTTLPEGDRQQFHYLTTTASTDRLAGVFGYENHTISSAELTTWLSRIPARKQVVILDACNSGQLIADFFGAKDLETSRSRSLNDMSNRTGTYLLSSSAADLRSYEAGNFGHGVLTYALLRGIVESAKRDQYNFFRVGVTELFEFARKEVYDLTEKSGSPQRPQLAFPNLAGSFSIGYYPDSLDIPLPKERPVLLRPLLLDDTSFRDDAGISQELARKLATRAAIIDPPANFAYFDALERPNTYQLRALYRRNKNNKIEVDAKLVHPLLPPIPIKIEKAKTAARIAGYLSKAINNAMNGL